MEPPVRPVFTILAKKEGVFVSAEIPGLDIAERPCFYAGKMNKPNLAQSSNSRILELMSMVKGEKPTLAAILLFGDYPQAYFPQLSIIAISVPGKEIGKTGLEGERFIDNKRIEGTLPQMLEDALAFIRKNTKTKTIIDRTTGERTDRFEYPAVAVREAILNALIHRDYSIHTGGMPAPVFRDERGTFSVCFYKDKSSAAISSGSKEMQLLAFCETFRTRQ